MNCTQIRAALPALVYDDLPPEQAAALREHLAACPACRAEEAALRQVSAQLNVLSTPPIHVDLARLYQEASQLQQRRLRRWRRIAVVFSAAAAALLLILGLRLEVRVQAHEVVLRWGTPPEHQELPAPQPRPQALAQSHEDNYLTQQLIHALAEDVAVRDRENQESLGSLEARVNALQRQAQERWDATQRFVSTLLTLNTTSVAKKE
jgi:Putative zinc-finger